MRAIDKVSRQIKKGDMSLFAKKLFKYFVSSSFCKNLYTCVYYIDKNMDILIILI